MSPLMLVLLVMFTPLEDPICLFFILDAKSLSATAIVGGGGAGGQGEGRERRPRGEDGRRREDERRQGKSSGTGVHDLQYDSV